MAGATAKLALITGVFATAFVPCPTAHAATNYKVLHYFTGADGEGPYGGVVIDRKGDLYGTTVAGGAGGGTVFELAPQPDGKWSATVLHSFENDGRGGGGPYGTVVFDAAGDLYGTTSGGGTHFRGVVFELTHAAGRWDEKVLHDFCSRQNCNDGGTPIANLMMDRAGNLYGTAFVVFELSGSTGDWSEKVLHRICPPKGCPFGGGARSGLIFDASGNLYATAASGGIGCATEGCGFVYELTPTSDGKWKELVLHAFDNNGKDGYTPGNGALMMDSSGNLYGTTESGGCCGGTVFKLTPGTDGHWKESILHNFKPGASGSFPTAGVVMDKAGNLYGTTVDGGTSCDCGVVYKLTPGSNGKWTYTVLHAFSGGDGAVPAGNLILDDKGNLYGGTVLGGGDNNGVIFELTP